MATCGNWHISTAFPASDKIQNMSGSARKAVDLCGGLRCSVALLAGPGPAAEATLGCGHGVRGGHFAGGCDGTVQYSNHGGHDDHGDCGDHGDHGGHGDRGGHYLKPRLCPGRGKVPGPSTPIATAAHIRNDISARQLPPRFS